MVAFGLQHDGEFMTETAVSIPSCPVASEFQLLFVGSFLLAWHFGAKAPVNPSFV